MDYRHERSIPEVLTDLLGQITSLFRTEGQLVRVELAENVGRLRTGVVLVVLGTVLLTPALVVLLEAAVDGLADTGLARGWAALAIGGGALVIGLIVLLAGLSSLKLDRLLPTKTIHQLQQDAFVAKQQVRRNDEQQRAA